MNEETLIKTTISEISSAKPSFKEIKKLEYEKEEEEEVNRNYKCNFGAYEILNAI